MTKKTLKKEIKSIGRYLGCNEEELLSEVLPLIKKQIKEARIDEKERIRQFVLSKIDAGYGSTVERVLIDIVAQLDHLIAKETIGEK